MIQQKKVIVNINAAAAKHNAKTIRQLLKPKTRLWAVVKSNAYGHGLVQFSKLINPLADGFCVDSVVEGIRLRENGIKKPILVLGPVLPDNLKEAARQDITVTISNSEALKQYLKSKEKPKFHLKIDTGMRRQGFFPQEIKKIKSQLSIVKNQLLGIYTHFASAKDINYPTFTEMQFAEFLKAVSVLEKAGFKNLIKHCAATGAAMINPKYHLDAARIGIGFYGLWPSKELQVQLSDKIKLQPVLSWQSVVSEVKNLKKGDYVGYDLTEKISKPTQAAVIPIGYWHGFDRKLSGTGCVLVRGKRAKVLGRVSMDLIVVDITGIKVKIGDRAVLIGNQLSAYEMAEKVGTTHYEIVTRINPLIERVIV